jgi:hypothetical protein
VRRSLASGPRERPSTPAEPERVAPVSASRSGPVPRVWCIRTALVTAPFRIGDADARAPPRSCRSAKAPALKPNHRHSTAGQKCPAFTMICAYTRSAGQGSANDDSVSWDNRGGARGAASQPRPRRFSLHLGALVLCCGPTNRELLSVLNSVAGPSAMATCEVRPSPAPSRKESLGSLRFPLRAQLFNISQALLQALKLRTDLRFHGVL